MMLSRADERSVIRRMNRGVVNHTADNGLRPHPPYELKNLEELYQCGLREIETEVGSYFLPA